MHSHREEPPQNHNKSAKKMLFFHGNFDMVGTRTAIALHVNVGTVDSVTNIGAKI